MPVINTLDKHETTRYKHSSKKDNLNNKWVYNTCTWRELRLFKLSNQPLCEICEKKQIIKLATEVHHITPLSTTTDKMIKKQLGFDYNNLMSLCANCHKDQHKIYIE